MSGTIIQRDNNMHWHMTMPPFLNKLLIMVEDESSDNLIRWAEDGLSFVVLRRDEFAKEILPRFFKHTNFPSFVRQLNIYGFRKVPHLQQSGLISGAEAESWKFSNKNFRRGRKELLHLIRRKEGTVVNNKDIDGDSEGSIEATCAAQNGRETESSVRPNSQRPASSEETLGSKVRRLEDENRLLRAQARAADEQAKLQQKTIDILVQLVVCGFENGSKLPELSTPPLGSISNSSDLMNDVGSSDGGSSTHYGQSSQQQQQQQQQPPAKWRRLSSGRSQSSGHEVGDGSTPTLRHKVPSPLSNAFVPVAMDPLDSVMAQLNSADQLKLDIDLFG